MKSLKSLKSLRNSTFVTKESLALFFISIAAIALQLSIMRVFSVGNWGSFGSMVISIALLGNGFAGTLLTFLQKRLRANPARWLKGTAFAIIPAIVISYLLAQLIPFNPVLIVSQKIQWLWIALEYIVYAIPFFSTAMFIGVVFTAYSKNAGTLYFWDMAGAGLGGFIILGLMYLLPTKYLIIPVVFLNAIGVLLLCFEPKKEEKGVKVDLKFLLAFLAVLVVAVTALIVKGDIYISLHKGSTQAKIIHSDLEEIHYEFSPLGEMEVFSSDQFHFAPGLSDNAVFYLDEMPKKSFLALYINGDGPINIMRQLTEKESVYMDFLPMTAPYMIKDKPEVLLIGLGGGFGAHAANYHEASKITVVESNPSLVKLMKENDKIRDFNNDLLNRDNITTYVQEPRAFVRKRDNKKKFDIVEISLVDSIGLSSSLGAPLNENYTYTVEGIRDYCRALKDDGILAITVWNKLTPPRNVPRLISTVIAGLEKAGVEDPQDKIFSFNLLYGTATILVKMDGFSDDELYELKDFCSLTSFDDPHLLWYPGMPEPENIDFEMMLDSYQEKYGKPLDEITPEWEGTLVPRLPSDLYYYTFKWIFEGREKELYEKYIFDIRPSTDNKPFFTAFMNGTSFNMFYDELPMVSEEWGYLLLPITLIQSLIFGALIILIPLIGGKKRFATPNKDIVGIILYYACLGLGFMFIEIFLIQKLVFFYGDPIFSTSIVITTMLILSGVGSLYSSGFKDADKIKKIRIASFVVVGMSIVFYALILPYLLQALLGLPIGVRMLAGLIVIAPAAFCMGMFFPTGLSTLTKKEPGLVPWAWGINGALSVTGTILPKLISIHFGFVVVLILAGLFYLGAGLLFPFNMKRK